ncbi:hypothetical protein Val02_00650 [Virgisporangium aliadipatigenens]|uniref:Secreted protein n=1 Tax=Virgisporangium aliadipatigenens TaxID=741659 RepID=A0A8J4DMA8_9ACTN|nr:hypothetical protein [Virgisporangium aliadipatigenens]GIJ43179.1 hypothetical protein Val02_00650 [Virgisporangium aliadipatigenens]
MGATAVVMAVLGLNVITGGPAQAASQGTWRPYGNTNPITSSDATWRCASTKTVNSNVLAQVCAIRSVGGGAVQAAVIVRNNRSSLYSISASADLVKSPPVTGDTIGYWTCPSSGVAAHSWSVCFGSTETEQELVDSHGVAGGLDLGTTGYV